MTMTNPHDRLMALAERVSSLHVDRRRLKERGGIVAELTALAGELGNPTVSRVELPEPFAFVDCEGVKSISCAELVWPRQIRKGPRGAKAAYRELRPGLHPLYTADQLIAYADARVAEWKQRAEAAERERDALLKDAERYRWLRNDSIDYPYGETKSSPWCVYGPNSGAIESRPIEGRELDEEVDAAIAAERGDG